MTVLNETTVRSAATLPGFLLAGPNQTTDGQDGPPERRGTASHLPGKFLRPDGCPRAAPQGRRNGSARAPIGARRGQSSPQRGVAWRACVEGVAVAAGGGHGWHGRTRDKPAYAAVHVARQQRRPRAAFWQQQSACRARERLESPRAEPSVGHSFISPCVGLVMLALVLL
jgi:hypothetical protein